jgi:hypothetical protein
MEINMVVHLWNNSIFKKSNKQVKNVYNVRHNPIFHNSGVNILLEDDPMFMAVSIYSLCGALHFSSQRSERLPYISFGFNSFMYVRFFQPMNPRLRKDCVPPTFTTHAIYCVCLILHLC